MTAGAVHSPEQVVTNEDLVARFQLDVDAAWIEARTGIRSRRWLAEGQVTSDLAVGAARGVLARAGVRPQDVDRILLATVTPDYPSPSTALVAARKLGARCMAVDLSAACAGFMYALDLGVASLVSGAARNVLVICADARSRSIDPRDRRSIVLFGDGAAAVLLEACEAPGFRSIVCGGEGHEALGAWVPAGGTAQPITAEAVAEGLHFLRIDRKDVIFDQFVGHTLEICDRALRAAGCTVDDIDHFVTHQGNARLVERLADALRIPQDKALHNIAHHGNTSGAALPMGLVEGWHDGRIRPGSTVLMSSVGAGSAFGAAVYQFAP